MKELIILSGKGGTGKTSIVGSLAVLAENKVMADCDVDAADLHLLLSPQVRQKEEFWSGQTAFIDAKKCNHCGVCVDLCRFDAIHNFEVDPIACEGCGFCSHVCPTEAITMQDNMAGYLFVSDTKYGTLAHAKLGIAQENSGKLVARVRQEAKKIATATDAEYIICDGPPGMGCPVVSSLSGANMALLVVEPTLSGIHDMGRVLDVCRHFKVPALVCINKFDINEENTAKIENYCNEQNVKIMGKIPFDNVVTEAMIQGVPVVEFSDNKVSQEIKNLWQNVLKSLNEN
ncbi:MAG: 4Fe-4S binding protein [Dehalococcoidales bacterium]